MTTARLFAAPDQPLIYRRASQCEQPSPRARLLEMHDLRPDDDDQREGERRADDAQGRVLGQVVGDLLGPLACAQINR